MQAGHSMNTLPAAIPVRRKQKNSKLKMKTIHDSDNNWKDLIEKAKGNYKFQPMLTAKLDNYDSDFTEMTMLEIVLWKTNRYPEFTKDILDVINDLRRSFTLDKAKSLLARLLTLKGFDLPMASTVLRFACPDELQIIDQRVYRFISANGDTFKKP